MPVHEAWSDIAYCALTASNVEKVLQQTLASALVDDAHGNNTELSGAICEAFGFSKKKDPKKYLPAISDVVSKLNRDHGHSQWENLKGKLHTTFGVAMYDLADKVEEKRKGNGKEMGKKWTGTNFDDDCCKELVYGMVQHVIKHMKYEKCKNSWRYYSFDDIIKLDRYKWVTEEIRKDLDDVRLTRNDIVHNPPHTFADNKPKQGRKQDRDQFQQSYECSVRYCVNHRKCFPLRAEEELKGMRELKMTHDDYSELQSTLQKAIDENKREGRPITALLKERSKWKRKADSLFSGMVTIKALSENAKVAKTMDEVKPIVDEIHGVASKHVGDGSTS